MLISPVRTGVGLGDGNALWAACRGGGGVEGYGEELVVASKGTGVAVGRGQTLVVAARGLGGVVGDGELEVGGGSGGEIAASTGGGEMDLRNPGSSLSKEDGLGDKEVRPG